MNWYCLRLESIAHFAIYTQMLCMLLGGTLLPLDLILWMKDELEPWSVNIPSINVVNVRLHAHSSEGIVTFLIKSMHLCGNLNEFYASSQIKVFYRYREYIHFQLKLTFWHDECIYLFTGCNNAMPVKKWIYDKDIFDQSNILTQCTWITLFCLPKFF